MYHPIKSYLSVVSYQNKFRGTFCFNQVSGSRETLTQTLYFARAPKVMKIWNGNVCFALFHRRWIFLTYLNRMIAHGSSGHCDHFCSRTSHKKGTRTKKKWPWHRALIPAAQYNCSTTPVCVTVYYGYYNVQETTGPRNSKQYCE